VLGSRNFHSTPPDRGGRRPTRTHIRSAAAWIARLMFLRLKRSRQCTSRGCVQLQGSRVVSSRPGLARKARRMPRTTKPGAVRVDRNPRDVLFAYEPKHCSYATRLRAAPMHGFIKRFADGVFYPEEVEIWLPPSTMRGQNYNQRSVLCRRGLCTWRAGNSREAVTHNEAPVDSAASMYQASEVERFCSGPSWVSARIRGISAQAFPESCERSSSPG
jgi:hypothetical protein